eukprot:m.499675 g.499675  ORF g.499675 m.499675 type:complete len:290 (-) comp21827_c0_seq2:1988-2857(-)
MGKRKKLSLRRPVTSSAPKQTIKAEDVLISRAVPTKNAPARKRTKTISTFHMINKQLAAAERNGDKAEVSRLQNLLHGIGGLETYQRSSVKGHTQTSANTAKWLISTLKSLDHSQVRTDPPLTLLDVGALDANYEKTKWINADAIDLNSRHPKVQAIDFFDFVPQPPTRTYDIVALSLVLNFVPDPRQRGAMLVRACQLVRPRGRIFIVLPRACVENSRYLTMDSLTELLSALGLEVTLSHLSPKLVYVLATLASPSMHANPDAAVFKRQVLRSGSTRNNFCILLQAKS